MRRTITILVVLASLVTMGVSPFISRGQQKNSTQQVDPANDPLQPGHWMLHKLPKSARIGSTPERIAAWNKLSADDKEKVKKIFSDAVEKAKKDENARKHQDDDLPDTVMVSATDKDGNRKLFPAKLHKKGEKSAILSNLKTAMGQNRYLTLATTAAPSNREIVQSSFRRAFAHRRRGRTSVPSLATDCWKGPEQFLRTFYDAVLVRPPYASELSYWMNTFAQAQSQGTLLSAAQSLGYTLFQSQEYANRGRSNRDFVFDCYEAFLQRYPDQDGWDFWTSDADQYGQAAVLQGFIVCDEFSNDVAALCDLSTFDGDQDSLSDDFENKIGDAFTPKYHISVGEPDQFATFNDSPFAPETIKRLFGQNPVSHFRVHKAGFATNPSGETVGVVRIDYLTLWNYDSGLVSGADCGYGLFGLDDLIAALTGHYLDHERSAMLVAAPLSNNDYNSDPNAYSLYFLYTAGHEFTLGDTSNLFGFWPSISAPWNFDLALSRSKHATYVFNPDYMPLTPWWIIVTVYDEIWQLYVEGWIPWWWYYALLEIADDVFFNCIVERFTDQGGQLSLVRTDVGELGAPLNSSSFIAVPDITRQFYTAVCRWGECPF